MLTPEQQGMLVCDALNRLPHPQDVAEQNQFAEGCCPDCCAPCGLLRELDFDAQLDDMVRLAPADLWTDVAWMTPTGVDRAWLRAVWGCQSQPQCLRSNVSDVLDGFLERIRQGGARKPDDPNL